MSNQTRNPNQAASDETVEVLYQKMGNRWFAFSLVDNEVFVGSISQDEIDVLDAKTAANGANANAKMFKISGNS